MPVPQRSSSPAAGTRCRACRFWFVHWPPDVRLVGSGSVMAARCQNVLSSDAERQRAPMLLTSRIRGGHRASERGGIEVENKFCNLRRQDQLCRKIEIDCRLLVVYVLCQHQGKSAMLSGACCRQTFWLPPTRKSVDISMVTLG